MKPSNANAPSVSMSPTPFHIPINRRRFFRSMAVASAGFTLPGYLAEALTLSPTVTQGPYYPLARNIPLDKDNDLVQMTDRLTAATGTITHITGRVLTQDGTPVRGALVELWHADDQGEYLYSSTATRNTRMDASFAGFGQFLTGSTGAFRFRTIKAGLYVGRTRHFHWGVTLPGQLTRTTSQTFWNETALGPTGSAWATQNSNDNVLSRITNAEQRASVLLSFTPVSGTTTGEVEATWDYVSGRTPAEPTYPGSGSLVVAGQLVSGPAGGNPRYRITVPAYAGYAYEVYGNPTLGPLTWSALPFSLTQTGTLDRNLHTATVEGSLDLFIEAPATRGFYYVAFRVPGANTGTP